MKRVDVGRRDEADELPGNDGCQASGSSARLRSGEDSKHTHTQVKFKSISAICKVKTDLTLLDDGTSATKKGLGGRLNATWTWVTIVKSGKNIKYIVTCASSQVSIVTAV